MAPTRFPTNSPGRERSSSSSSYSHGVPAKEGDSPLAPPATDHSCSLKTTSSQKSQVMAAVPKSFGRDFSIRLGSHQLKLHAQIYPPAVANQNSQTFVMIHGFQSNRATFARMAPLLQKQGHRVYALDLPGHGKSERPEWFNYSNPDWYAEAIQGFLLTAGLKDVHLVGHSMGGGISTMFALKHPDNISRLTLLSPWSKDIFISTLGKTWPFSWVTAGFLALSPELNMKRGLRDTSWDKAWTRDNGIMGRLTESIDQEDVEISFHGMLQDTVEMDWGKLEKVLSPENIARLKRRVGEVNIYYGEKDTLIPEGQVEDLARLLGTEVIKVEGTGHVFPLESPEVAFSSGGCRAVADHRVPHVPSGDLPEGGDYYRGPYFQWGLRSGFQTNLNAYEMNLPTQLFFNVDHDHYQNLQPGLEFGLQSFAPIKNSGWVGSAYGQPKFYWFRDTWLELSSAVMAYGGVGDFKGSKTPGFFSVDAQVIRPELILLNNGFLIGLIPILSTNLFHSQKNETWNMSDRSFAGLMFSLSQ